MIYPFHQYMQKWLYDEANGYYTKQHIGTKGDFYTSVNVSKFFGGAISRFVLKLLESKRLSLPLCIVEIGSNNGALISDIAEFLVAFNETIFQKCEFCTIEPLSYLQKLQYDTFANRITQRFQKQLHIFHSCEKLRSFEDSHFFFIANELFDSMACDVILHDSMLYYTDSEKFVWDMIAPEVIAFQTKYQANGAEISLEWEKFISNLICTIQNPSVFLTFDYGDFSYREMNLRFYREHKVYNFYEALQNNMITSFFATSDITYDVDFNVLCRIFEAFGARKEFCLTQSKTLIEECEILEVFEAFSAHFSPITLLKQRTSLHGLIAPNAMGERFKALCMSF